MSMRNLFIVIPAKAGIHTDTVIPSEATAEPRNPFRRC